MARDDSDYDDLEEQYAERAEVAIEAAYQSAIITIGTKIEEFANFGMDREQILDELDKQLQEGGSIFRQMEAQLSEAFSQTQQASARIEDLKSTGEPLGDALQQRFRRIAVLENTCVDCLFWHDQVYTYEEWMQVTIPGDGRTVCGPLCQCVLVPEADIEAAGLSSDDFDTPLVKLQKTNEKNGTARQLKMTTIKGLDKQMTPAQRDRLRAKYSEGLKNSKTSAENRRRIQRNLSSLGQANKEFINS